MIKGKRLPKLIDKLLTFFNYLSNQMEEPIDAVKFVQSDGRTY